MGTVASHLINFARLNIIQQHVLLDKWNWRGLYDFASITKVYLIPEITMEWNKLYMLVAFDFLPAEEYNVKSFPERISLN